MYYALFTRMSCNYYTNTCSHARCSTHTTNFCVIFTHYHVSVAQIIDVGLMLMVISDHATNTDARINGKVFVHVLTHS